MVASGVGALMRVDAGATVSWTAGAAPADPLLPVPAACVDRSD